MNETFIPEQGTLRHPLLFLIVALWALFAVGCATSPVIPGSESERIDISTLPRQSPDASEILLLQSNVNCQFFIDGQPMIKGRRVRLLVTRRLHKVTCKPEGYVAKDEYIQPPFDPRFPIGFTFLIEDKIPKTPTPRPAERLTATRRPEGLHRSYNDVARFLSRELARVADSTKVLAILGFRSAGKNSKVALSVVLADELQVNLVRLGLQVVERSRLNAVARELRFQQMDLFEERNATKIGQFIGANGVIVGTIVDNPATGTVRISARLLEVETARVLHAVQAELIRNATVINLLKSPAK